MFLCILCGLCVSPAGEKRLPAAASTKDAERSKVSKGESARSAGNNVTNLPLIPQIHADYWPFIGNRPSRTVRCDHDGEGAVVTQGRKVSGSEVGHIEHLDCPDGEGAVVTQGRNTDVLKRLNNSQTDTTEQLYNCPAVAAVSVNQWYQLISLRVVGRFSQGPA